MKTATLFFPVSVFVLRFLLYPCSRPPPAAAPVRATIVRIAQDGPRDGLFAVPEDRVALMRIGSRVDLRQWSDGSRLSGAIREGAALADPVTRTYLVKVALEGTQPPPLGFTLTVFPQVLSTKGLPA
ncbi:MAG: hypothetical protein LH632_19085 [Rhodoferax sp.]|nr:hypothetical protein [Rhodoferax sp.]